MLKMPKYNPNNNTHYYSAAQNPKQTYFSPNFVTPKDFPYPPKTLLSLLGLGIFTNSSNLPLSYPPPPLFTMMYGGDPQQQQQHPPPPPPPHPHPHQLQQHHQHQHHQFQQPQMGEFPRGPPPQQQIPPPMMRQPSASSTTLVSQDYHHQPPHPPPPYDGKAHFVFTFILLSSLKKSDNEVWNI